MFKSQNKLVHAFCLKDRIPSKCTYGVVYKIQSGHFNELWYSEYIKTLMQVFGNLLESHHWLRRELGVKVVLLSVVPT